MSNAAHISGQNASFTLPHSPALRGCDPCVVADAFTSSLHVGQRGDSAIWMPALAGTRKPSTMRSTKRSSPWSLPCLSGHTLRGLSCAQRHSVFCFDFVALRVTVPPGTSLHTAAKNAAQISSGSLPESRPSALGSMAHYHPSMLRPLAGDPGISLRLRQWVTRPIREFNLRRLTMYQNRITLIGFPDPVPPLISSVLPA